MVNGITSGGGEVVTEGEIGQEEETEEDSGGGGSGRSQQPRRPAREGLDPGAGAGETEPEPEPETDVTQEDVEGTIGGVAESGTGSVEAGSDTDSDTDSGADGGAQYDQTYSDPSQDPRYMRAADTEFGEAGETTSDDVQGMIAPTSDVGRIRPVDIGYTYGAQYRQELDQAVEQRAENIEAQFSPDVPAAAGAAATGIFGFAGGAATRSAEAAQPLRVDPDEDLTVQTDESGQVRITPTESFEEDLTRLERSRAQSQFEDRLEEETGADLDPGEDFTVEETEEGYRAELTEAGERALVVEDAPGPLEGIAGSVLGPPGDFEQGLRRAAGDAGDRVFGPPGDVERGIRDFVSPVTDPVTGPPGEFERGLRSAGSDLASPITGPAGQLEQDIVEGADEAATFVQEEYVDPYAEGLATVSAAPTRAAAAGAGALGLEGVESALGDVAGGSEYVVEGVSRGAGSALPFLIRGPSNIQRLGETTAGAAEFAVTEHPADTFEATGEAAAGATREIAEQGFTQPAFLAGQLVGTGGTFAAARRVGPRTSGVTRAAIQPGEELLGRVGARATPGRAGDVLFPRGEPLFASEEAAMAVGSRAASGVRSGGRRAAEAARRAELPSVEATLPSSPIRRQRVLTEEGLESEIVVDTPGLPSGPDVTGRLQSARQRASEAATRARAELALRRGPDPFTGEIEAEVGEQEDIQGVMVLEGEGEFEMGQETEPYEPMGEAGEAGRIGSNVLTEVDVGGGQVAYQRLQTERRATSAEAVEAEQEARERAATETEVREAEVFQEATESDLLSETLTQMEPSTELEQQPGLEVEPTQEFLPESDMETEPELEQETEQETEFELETELALEQELERELEFELEAEGEREAESELETELFSREDPDEPGPGLPMFEGEQSQILTDFIDPLSGDVLETEADVGEPRIPGFD